MSGVSVSFIGGGAMAQAIAGGILGTLSMHLIGDLTHTQPCSLHA